MPSLYSNRPPCRSTRVYPLRNVRYLRNLAVPSKSRNFRFGSNRRVQSAFRERSVLAPLSHSVYDRFFWPGGNRRGRLKRPPG
jgi:hypothetical protein